MKLFLDDVRDPPSSGWTVVRTAEEAKPMLLSGLVEEASLDHDLGECAECAAAWPPRGYRLVTSTCRHKMTGYDLCLWMAEFGHWPKNKPTVHSANPVGRQRMEGVIARYFQRCEAAR